MSEWTLTYQDFDPKQEPLREALCTLGNGYFATRGAAPESRADETHYPGTYVAGCFNRLTTEIAGREVENECMVNVPNWLPLSFQLEGGEWFDLQKVEILEYRQELDVRRGVLTRLIRFMDDKGRSTRVTQRRFVHMAMPHLAGLETTCVAEDWEGRLDVRCALDGRITNSGVARYRQLRGDHLEPVETASFGGDSIYLQVVTRSLSENSKQA